MIEDLFNDWQIIGLTLNIVGVYFILNSLIFKKPRRFLNDYYGIEKRRPKARGARRNAAVELTKRREQRHGGTKLSISHRITIHV